MIKRLQKDRDRARAEWNRKLCPRIHRVVKRNMDKVNDCIPIKSSDIHYQVSCFEGDWGLMRNLKRMAPNQRGREGRTVTCSKCQVKGYNAAGCKRKEVNRCISLLFGIMFFMCDL